MTYAIRWLLACSLLVFTFSACKKDHTLKKNVDKLTTFSKWHVQQTIYWDFRNGGDSVTIQEKDITMTLKMDSDKTILYESGDITYSVPLVRVTDYSLEYEILNEIHSVNITLYTDRNEMVIREVIPHGANVENIRLNSY